MENVLSTNLETISVPAFNRKTGEMEEMNLSYDQFYSFEKVNGEIFYGWIDTNVDSLVRTGIQLQHAKKDLNVIFLDYEYVEHIGIVRKKIPLDITSNDDSSIRFIRPAKFIFKQIIKPDRGRLVLTIPIDGLKEPFNLYSGQPLTITTKELLNLQCEVARIQHPKWYHFGKKKPIILYVRELADTKHPLEQTIPIRINDIRYISHLECSIK